MTVSGPTSIILDLMMPVMDGVTFHAALKESPDLAGIPVIGVTAAATASDVDFECLRKPVRFDTLVRRIHTTMLNPHRVPRAGLIRRPGLGHSFGVERVRVLV